MRGEVEPGVKVSRLGGGLICSTGTSGMDTPSRIRNSFYAIRTTAQETCIEVTGCCSMLPSRGMQIILELSTTNYIYEEKRSHTETGTQLNTESSGRREHKK